MTPTAQRAESALLVVDMQNAFCHREGSFANMLGDGPLSIDMCVDAIDGCRRLLAVARATSIPVIFTRYVYHQGYVEGGILLAKYPAMRDVGSLAADSWDAEIVQELTPATGEIVIDKARYSAFYGTRLEPVLAGLGVRSLILCGVTTNVCVESTARDAAQRDYQVFVVADATGELSRARHDNALAILDYGFGWVVTADQVAASLTAD